MTLKEALEDSDIQVSIEMERNAILLTILACFVCACSSNISPSKSLVIGKQDADERYEYYYVEGLRNKLLGAPEEAVSCFNECIEISPERDGAYYQIAQIVYMKGDFDEAARYCSLAIERNKNLWYYILLGDIWVRKGNIDAAIDVYSEAEMNFSGNDELKFMLGKLYFDNGSFEKSAEIFGYFEEKYGMGGNSAIPLVQSLMRMKRYNEAEEKIMSLIEMNPGDFEFMGLLAELYRDSGQDQKAGSVYELLIKENPDDVRVLFSLTEFLRRVGSYEDIFNILNSVALKDGISEEDKVSLFAMQLEDPKIITDYSREFEIPLMILEAAHEQSPVVKLLRAELYQLTGRLDEASRYLEAYVMTWPQSYYAWEKLLLICSEMNNNEKLYALSATAVRNFNTAILPRMLNAFSAVDIGLYDEALSQLERVRRLSNENREIILQILSLEADAYYRKGEVDRSFEKYESALEIDPDNTVLLNNYAYFLAENDLRLKDALKMIEKVMDVEQKNSTYNDTHAWVLYKMGKLRKAEGIMRAIIESGDNEDAEYYEHFGFILKALKKCGEAVISWAKAIEMDNSKLYLKQEIEKCIGERR